MAYRQQRTIIITEPETQPETKNNLDLTKNEPDPDHGNLKAVDIPPKYLYGNDLKKIPSFLRNSKNYR